ncbi:hypothetical protein BGZ46_007028 [Entomortierella lignicola]|nr:hypothetical protein BGZ46_007028 [Entomortierella lignicola]
MQYMRHQEFHKHQQRYQSHSRGRGPGQGNVHHDEWRMWHFWHLTESRKTFVKSLTFGITISCLGIWFSNSRSRHMQQWIDFVEDVMHIKNAIEDAMGITRGMSSIQSRPNYLRTPLASSTMLSPEHMFKDAPILQKPHETFKNIRMFTPEQVELRLGQHQKSFRIVDKAVKRKNNRVSTTDQRLVAGYCTNQLSSNSTNEDDSSQHVIRGENGEIERLFWGVFDGHSGWCCSQKVAKDLAPSVAKELDLVRDPGNTKAIVEAIEQGFLKLDQRIVHDTVRRVLENPSKPLACSSLLPAISGSCALMAYVDIKRRDLYVACAGDSRAVMGVREPLEEGGHVWRAVPLSFDQTGRNQWEVKRLKDEHPGEEDTVLTNSRILGRLEPTRAFGDARYKWSKEIQEKVFKLFPYYRQPYKNLNTPPYVTAKPVVQHQKIQPEDRFLVMATDGLWDKLTSDEVVQLVGDLLDGKTGHDEMTLNGEDINLYRQQGRNAIQTSSSSTLNNNEQQKQELIPPNVTANGPASQIRRFTYRDQANAATHLIRNALGGADDDKLAATLSIPSPMSRIYRDDITVTVVFFGQQDTTVALSDANNSDDLVEIH